MKENKVYIAPSLERANWLRIEEEIRELEEAGSDILHIDIMDRTFGNTILFSPKIISDIKKITNIPLDIHMYVNEPEYYFPILFQDCGKNDYINIEIESVKNISYLLEEIKRNGVRPAVSIDTGTPLSFLEPILHQVDLINLLVRNAGNTGERITDYIIDKVQTSRRMIKNSGREILLEVDGSITFNDTKLLYDAGANVFVYGTKVIFRPGIPYKESISKIRNEYI